MRKAVGSALLFLSSLAVALAIGEILVRVLVPHARDHVVPAGLFRIDGRLGWALNPGAHVRHRTKYFDVVYSVNDEGFREEPGAADTTTGPRRILFFGDSESFGWGVDTSQRVSNVLERLLPRSDVRNFGAPGYGLDQQVLSYEAMDAANPGTTVVFLVTSATLRRTLLSEAFRKPKPRFVLDSGGKLRRIPVAGTTRRFADFAYRIASPFYLPYFVEFQWLRYKGSGRFRTPGVSGRPVDVSRLPLQKAILLEAKRIAAAREHRMVALVGVDSVAAANFREFCAANGILFTDTPWFPTPIELVHGKDDIHWTARAHELVAARLSAPLGEMLAKDAQ